MLSRVRLSRLFYPNGSRAPLRENKNTGAKMGRSNLQKCPDCGAYSLNSICPTCGAKMRVAAPLKFSPEDRQGERRRERKGVGSGSWVASLPSIKENKGEEE